MTHFFGLFALVLATTSPDDNSAQVPSRYNAVMRAQYAAHTPVIPQRPEEAQRIYDTYLKAIGEKHQDIDSVDSTQPR